MNNTSKKTLGTMTAEEKAAAKAAAAEALYQKQLAALLAAGLDQETAEKAVAALKPVKVVAADDNRLEQYSIPWMLARQVADGLVLTAIAKPGSINVPREDIAAQVRHFLRDRAAKNRPDAKPAAIRDAIGAKAVLQFSENDPIIDKQISRWLELINQPADAPADKAGN